MEWHVSLAPAADLLSDVEALAALNRTPEQGDLPGFAGHLAAAVERVDGPDSETGYSFRMRQLTVTAYAWPGADYWRRFPSGRNARVVAATYETTGADKALDAAMFRVRYFAGRPYVAFPAAPADRLAGGGVHVVYQIGDDQVPERVKRAAEAYLTHSLATPTAWLGPGGQDGSGVRNPAMDGLLSPWDHRDLGAPEWRSAVAWPPVEKALP